MKRFDDKCLDCVESSTSNVNLSVLLGKCENTENLEILESPGISRTGRSTGLGWFWKSFEHNVWQTVRRINFGIFRVKGLIQFSFIMRCFFVKLFTMQDWNWHVSKNIFQLLMKSKVITCYSKCYSTNFITCPKRIIIAIFYWITDNN